jgi:drug/metabolite transporter (DMT)-like permease
VLVAATFFMGSSFVAGKILLAKVPPLPLVGWRFVVAALALLPLALRDGLRVPAAEWPGVVAVGLLQTTGVMALLFLAMESIPAATASILLFTAPLWVAALARMLLGERLARAQVVGLALGVVGVALAVGGRAGAGTLAGDLLALGSAWCFAGAAIVVKRVQARVPSWTLSFWQMAVGAIALLVLAEASGQRWPSGLDAADWAWFLWLAIPASSGSFGLWFLALTWGGAARTSAFLFLAPLFTILLSVPVLGDRPGPGQLAGGACVAVALYLVNRPRPQRSLVKEASS